jgi:hypothetical protein
VRQIFFLILIINSPCLVIAQIPGFQLEVSKSQEKIKIDGDLSESGWVQAKTASRFMQNFPTDSVLADSQTEVKVLFDDQFIYIAAVCQNAVPGKYTITSLKRDFDPDLNDAFIAFIDPFQDGINGFMFSVNPMNVQREGIISFGGRISSDWDNKWYSSVKREEDKWTVEIQIPLKSIRFKENSNKWRMNFARVDLSKFQVSSWVPVPVNFDVNSLAFTGTIDFEEALKKPSVNISLIPYATGQSFKNYVAETRTNTKGTAGLDAKVALTSSLNLDLTFNPDFSQVEVDQQVTNLERFEIFFPERRQFFLENADLFSEFGFRRIKPFFSRRIGIGKDTVTNLYVQNRILYGARISGKIGNRWRTGLLNMQSARDSDAGIHSNNYTVATIQKQVFSRSTIGGIFVNKVQTSDVPENGLEPRQFNRLFGMDYNLATKDNKWFGRAFFHKSFSPSQNNDAYAHGSFLKYSKRRFNLEWNHEYVGKNYNAEVGYVQRTGYWRLEPSADYTFYPKKGALLRHGTYVYTEITANLNFQITDRIHRIGYYFIFKNTAWLEAFTNNVYIKLLSDFDPTNTDGPLKLAAGTDYEMFLTGLAFGTDTRKILNFRGYGSIGDHFNGTRYNAGGTINYRFQPFGNVSISGEYNKLSFPSPYKSAEFFLIGPKVELSFTDKLFLTTFIQYNSQINNMNINSRFQWRFKPVSDLFIIYSDNYYSNPLNVKNRALIMKLSYWFNV